MRLTMTPENRLALMTKFLERCGQSDVDGECWIWQGAVTGNAGGQTPHMSHEGIGGLARRIAWELYRWRLPDGACVCHSCAERLCVNPAHLFLRGDPIIRFYCGREKVILRRARLAVEKKARHATEIAMIARWLESGLSWRKIGILFGLTESGAWRKYRRAGRKKP